MILTNSSISRGRWWHPARLELKVQCNGCYSIDNLYVDPNITITELFNQLESDNLLLYCEYCGILEKPILLHISHRPEGVGVK